MPSTLIVAEKCIWGFTRCIRYSSNELVFWESDALCIWSKLRNDTVSISQTSPSSEVRVQELCDWGWWPSNSQYCTLIPPIQKLWCLDNDIEDTQLQAGDICRHFFFTLSSDDCMASTFSARQKLHKSEGWGLQHVWHAWNMCVTVGTVHETSNSAPANFFGQSSTSDAARLATSRSLEMLGHPSLFTDGNKGQSWDMCINCTWASQPCIAPLHADRPDAG